MTPEITTSLPIPSLKMIPYFYLANNDTLSLDFKVLANPITMMMDTISTREPDTVTIRPFYDPDYDYLWNDLSTLSTLCMLKKPDGIM